MKPAGEKKENKKAATILRAVAIAIGIALMTSGAIVFLEPRPRVESVVIGTDMLSCSLGLQVQLKNNLLYGDNVTLTNPPVVFTNITKAMFDTVTLNYSGTSKSPANVSVYYYVILNSTYPEWSKLVYQKSWSEPVSSGQSARMEMNISPTENFTEAGIINSQLNQSKSSIFSIKMLISCYVGSLVSNSNLTISNTTNNEYVVTGPNSTAPDVFKVTRNEMTGDPPFLPIEKEFSFVLIPVGIGVAALSLIGMKRKKDRVADFRKEHAEILVELANGPSKDAKRVAKAEDIVKISIITERPLFIFEDKVFIELGGTEYYAELKNT